MAKPLGVYADILSLKLLDQGNVLADVEQYNRRMRQRTGGWFARNDIFNVPNVILLHITYPEAFLGTYP